MTETMNNDSAPAEREDEILHEEKYARLQWIHGLVCDRAWELKRENDRIRTVLGLRSVYPVRDVLLVLKRAAHILLHEYDYDADGYETISEASDAADRMIDEIPSALHQ